jgi:hypothetical protein
LRENEKPKDLKVARNKKTKGSKQDDKIGHGNLCLREENNR